MKELSPEFKQALRDVILADGAPLVIDEMRAICDAECHRLLDDRRQADEDKEPTYGTPRWKAWDAARVRPRWLFWSSINSFLGHADWIRKEIEQRDWTNAQREEEKRKREIEQKRRELAALESAS